MSGKKSLNESLLFTILQSTKPVNNQPRTSITDVSSADLVPRVYDVTVYYTTPLPVSSLNSPRKKT